MRFRDLLAVIVGLAIVGAIGYGAWLWIGDRLSDHDREGQGQPGSDPAATARSYAQAWEQGDHLGMVRFVREPPDDFVARHTQLREGLEPRSVSIELGQVQEPQQGRASVPFTISLDVAYSQQPLSWGSTLNLTRERGEWAVTWEPSTIHPQLRDNLIFDTHAEQVSREEIYAADGTVLSGEQTLLTYGFRPDAVTDPQEVEEAFEAAFPGTADRVAAELGRGDLVDDWFYPIITVSEERASGASSILSPVSGVLRQTSSGRGLYSDNFALHIVGVVSEATAEQLEERNLPPETRIDIGQIGLERSQEPRLLGSEIVRAGLRDASADENAGLSIILSETQDDPSSPVHTTLDIQVQQAIENTLVGQTGSIGIVAIDAQDGAILGAASRPLGGYNRAFEGRYSPGSTFKTVTAEALIAGGLSPYEWVECPAQTTVGGLQVSNAGSRSLGDIDLFTAFVESCNTTFASLATRLDDGALTEAAQRFGFNLEHDLGLPHFGGSYPEPNDTAELAASAFGQARVEASVVHMASVAAAAAHGTWYAPYLIQDERVEEARPLAADAAEHLRAMMRGVVTDGTGRQADVDGLEVLGKTGTAQASGGIEHAWFIGYVDGIGFAILVEEGGSGGAVAAPIAHRFVQELTATRRSATSEVPTVDDNSADNIEDEDAITEPDE